MRSGQALRALGRIVRLQVQPSRLTLGGKPDQYYDPAGLVQVETLTLTRQGALARGLDGEAILDVHHDAHPRAYVTRDGRNHLSVNFTSHYAAMRDQYGPHMNDGCAGENILVETDGRVGWESLAGGLAIQPAGSQAPIWLQGIVVAKPCAPFSQYAQGSKDAAEIKATLQFLDHGTRGFYCGLAHSGEVTVCVGDPVLLPVP